MGRKHMRGCSYIDCTGVEGKLAGKKKPQHKENSLRNNQLFFSLIIIPGQEIKGHRGREGFERRKQTKEKTGAEMLEQGRDVEMENGAWAAPAVRKGAERRRALH